MYEKYDRIILGAGIYGLYAAFKSALKGYEVLILEKDDDVFGRGSYVNQARLHNGYHYPRSYSTAIKSAKYFDRFLSDYTDCINADFKQIYAIARNFSWVNADQFKKFCSNVGSLCEEVNTTDFFNPNEIEACFITKEYAFDANLIKKKMLRQIDALSIKMLNNVDINRIVRNDRDNYEIIYNDGDVAESSFIINTTYASTNQIHDIIGFEKLDIKYELCEVILCNVSEELLNTGLTVMDGPFFSVMPFGKTSYHSLTSVSRTPHATSYQELPTFICQERNHKCSPIKLENCNTCEAKPPTAYAGMNQIAKKYMRSDIEINYVSSLFTIKPILRNSEIDDSRPTIIRQYSTNPYFYTAFSGKMNTFYDLDQIL